MYSILSVFSAAVLVKQVFSAPAPQNFPGQVSPQDPRFTYYPFKTPLTGPCDLTTGPDGAIWSSNFITNTIGRVDPTTGAVTEYKVPSVNVTNLRLGDLAGRAGFSCVIQPGSDGFLYAASGIRNELIKINPTTKDIKVFTPPSTGELPSVVGNLEPFNDMWRGPKGMLYTQTTANVISYFTYDTEKFIDFHPPTPLAGPLGIYVASDGHAWFCEFFANKVGRLNFETGEIIEYNIPIPLTSCAVIRAETSDADGTYVWFTAFTGNYNGRVNIKTGEIRAFPSTSLLSFPTENTVDSQGNVWFSTATRNSVNKLNPNTGAITSVNQPGTSIVAPISVTPAVDIAVHYGPGNAIWFTELANNRIGRFQL
ncbi:hypothetical protein ONS95_004669 [Cadophora gregata]|uniref:uncharacterized protein n=1 Tax=Cadophora gregata TaxID=51156 RepID=UPI0026DD7F26|nr:uncharacterized protein ONS95_004669 [Cadophora gregata]KAK0099458.1 hypothetical protein ONS96_008295 [Cadophora gregata f. sp. sojae]KAK0104375.1 hypothetical protein ONS95_004669 [Cadophora gregata]